AIYPLYTAQTKIGLFTSKGWPLFVRSCCAISTSSAANGITTVELWESAEAKALELIAHQLRSEGSGSSIAQSLNQPVKLSITCRADGSNYPTVDSDRSDRCCCPGDRWVETARDL